MATDVSILDREAAIERLEGDCEEYESVLECFLSSVGDQVDTLSIAVRAGDRPTVALTAHLIRLDAEGVGAVGLAGAASRAEAMARDVTTPLSVLGEEIVRHLRILRSLLGCA